MGSYKKEKLTKTKERVKKYGEVYTPEWIVKKMCDALPDEAWGSVEKTFLEPSCGNGNFLVEILDRKLNLCKSEEDLMMALSSIYGIDILPDNVKESKQRMLNAVQIKFGFFVIEKAKKIIDNRIICGDSLRIMKELETKEWDDVIAGGELIGWNCR